MFKGDWYCLYTKPRQEALAAQSVLDAGFDVLAPRMEVRRVLRGKAVVSELPLFASYIFAGVQNEEDMGKLRYLRGVVRVVGFGKEGRSLKIPTDILAALDSFLDDQVYRLKEELRAGDPVMVLEGPLKGVEAVFKSGIHGTERASILFEILDTQQEVQIAKEHIIKKEDD